jgi:hypothetical protein
VKTEPTFKQLAIAFVAAVSPGASERERDEAEILASGLPFQFRSEAKALKVLIRDLDTRKVVETNPPMVPAAWAHVDRGPGTCSRPLASRQGPPRPGGLSTFSC